MWNFTFWCRVRALLRTSLIFLTACREPFLSFGAVSNAKVLSVTGEGPLQMRRISSRITFFNKRVFPVIWFGFLAIVVIAPLRGSKPNGGPTAGFLVVPIILPVFGYFMMKRFVFDVG